MTNKYHQVDECGCAECVAEVEKGYEEMLDFEFMQLITKHCHITEETFNTRVQPSIKAYMDVLERLEVAQEILRADKLMSENNYEDICNELAAEFQEQENQDNWTIR